MKKIVNGVTDKLNRKIRPVNFARDFDDLFTQYDANKIISLSRGLYHNNAIVKAAIEQKASYSVGNAFAYRCLSKDEDFRNTVNAALEQWSKIAEVSGKTFSDVVYLSSVDLDVDGDVFILLTETKDGYPLIQLIESHAVGSRFTGRKANGKNATEEKGVIYDKKTKRVIGYRILGETEEQDKIVSARDMIRISEPSGSVRGLPLVSAVIDTIYDLQHSQELLLTQHLIAASIAVIEKNDDGKAPQDVVLNPEDLRDTRFDTKFSHETIDSDGGSIRYFKSDSDGGIEVLTNNNPSMNWQEYQDTLTNQVIIALDWHKDLLGMSTGTGVFNRLAIQQAAKVIEDRQVLLKQFFIRICNYVVAKLIKNGFIDVELPDDWYLCDFTKPRKITVDFARDSKAILEEYRTGIKNLSQILDEEGIDHDTHVRQRYIEEAKRLKIKQEVETEYGVTITDTDARLINANQLTQKDQNENL